MSEAIEADKIIEYEKIDRSYGILVGKNGIRDLLFCPWCGVKLPENLSSTLFDVIEKEYGIRWEADLENFTNVPKEFGTDKWWKKRGL